MSLEEIRKELIFFKKWYGMPNKFVSDSTGINTCTISQVINNKVDYNISEYALKKLENFINERKNLK